MSKHSSTGKAWEDLRIKVLNRDGWMCSYCGKAVEGKQAQADHIIPKSKGGEDRLDNLVASCDVCNGTRQDRMLIRMNYVNKDWLDSL